MISGNKGAAVMLLGAKNRFEIWNGDEFEKHTSGVDMTTLPPKAEKARITQVG